MEDFNLSNTAPDTGFDFWLSNEELALDSTTSQELNPDEQVTLLDLVDSLLNKGVVVSGDIALSVAGVDLLYIGLRLMICTADKAVEVGAVRRKNGRIV